jgi:hypothetical protein
MNFKIIKRFLVFVCNLFFTLNAQAQKDSTVHKIEHAGSVGFSSNGFSIIPTFSLNSPAFITNLSWKKKNISFEPDIRLVPNGSKGGVLLWLRYNTHTAKKLGLRLGVHPAFSIIRRQEEANKREISELLRFAAFEIVPSYKVSKRLGLSAMYLQGHGLQKWGPQFTNVLFLNTVITGLGIGSQIKLNLYPSFFFLNTDNFKGDYFTLTTVLAHTKLPWSIQSTINKTIQSKVPGNRDFMWNLGLFYGFRRKELKKV